jgi:hypothetical protein
MARNRLRNRVVLDWGWSVRATVLTCAPREIPRPAGENAGLRDDASYGEESSSAKCSKIQYPSSAKAGTRCPREGNQGRTRTSVIFPWHFRYPTIVTSTGLEIMNVSPLVLSTQRAPRAHLNDIIPAVMRFEDGRRLASQLQVVSRTGGLLSVPRTVEQGAQVKLMFLTGAGSVLGGAEMLSPVSTTLQPFRFVSLAQDDQRRLGAVIQASSASSNSEQLWIEKLRAASALQAKPPRSRFLKRAMGAAGVITLGLASAIYFFHVPWHW